VSCFLLVGMLVTCARTGQQGGQRLSN
jgi:hypothetical protein